MNEDKPEKMPPVPPFVRFVASAVPMVFDDSLSYYEALCALWKYVQGMTDVINNNAALEEEYILKFNELKSFVDNYFDNLDVQEEINNKLDAMAEDGTLQEIITSYIQANVAWTFDTVADMKLAENLINGSYARTLGFRSINDGGGALYYINDTGTADERSVIAIDSLRAHLVLDKVVTPEQFGAYGDGTNDDTDAWQDAVDSGRDVKAFEKTYLVSTIEVTDDINIDCGNASFITSATRLFNIHGEVVTTLANENDYTADDVDYAIVGAGYSSYTGFAFMRGDNNFQPSRDYYRGGFACTFDNGKINGSYPIPITNTAIDIINPIHGSLKNIKGITHQTVTNANRSILIKHAEGYLVENLCGKNLQAYVDVDICESLNVTCKNLNITHDVTFDDNVSYIVMIEDSSFCTVTESYLYNRKWHSWTTSGIYLCYQNKLLNSSLLSETGIAVCDHENALGSTIDNVTATCIVVSGLSNVNNVNINSVKDTQRRCQISLLAPCIEKNGIFTVTNVFLNMDANANGTYCGIWFNQSPFVTGQTYYYKNIYIENVKTNKATSARVYYNLPDTSNFVIEKVTMKSCWLDVNFPLSAKTNIDVSNSEFYLDDFNEYVVSKYADIGLSSTHLNKLTITNSHIRQITGAVTTVVLNNVHLAQDSSNLAATNIYASNLLARINAAVIKNATIVNIANMQYNSTTQQFNFVKANSTVYYQQVNTSTGEFETKTIA